MTQTLAVFYDAYRSLNAKKMFWAVLVLSALVAAAFGCVGINSHGVKVLSWQFDSQWFNTQVITPAVFYKQMFIRFGIGFWLSWLAAILALISTTGIFPDLITSGSIHLLISKPIGRLRLFATQYVAGLLFVILQVSLFTLACFLVIGLRGGAWEPGLFLAIPLVLCFFSYLYAICVLLGLVTRSALAALLLTLLFWLFMYLLGTAETQLLWAKNQAQSGGFRRAAAGWQRPGGRDATADRSNSPEEESNLLGNIEVAHNIVYAAKTVLPKTSETIGLLERNLIDLDELPVGPPGRPPEFASAQRETEETLRSRSVWWIVGTSLGFEAVVLFWAALIFCRRDY
jgi:ABC-type transport system involved in multi-copper enzyme maturation permease subunit